MRAKRANFFGTFLPLYRGKSFKNGQKQADIIGIFELKNLENIKTPFRGLACTQTGWIQLYGCNVFQERPHGCSCMDAMDSVFFQERPMDSAVWIQWNLGAPHGFSCMDSVKIRSTPMDSAAWIQLYGFSCMDSPVWIQLYGFSCMDSAVWIQLYGFIGLNLR